MNADDRDRLRRILATFDEAGLVALANKGLVRRAQKDLEAGGLTHEETDAAMIVRGPGWVVTMPPDGPDPRHGRHQGQRRHPPDPRRHDPPPRPLGRRRE